MWREENNSWKDSFITDVQLIHFSPYIPENDKIYVFHSAKSECRHKNGSIDYKVERIIIIVSKWTNEKGIFPTFIYFFKSSSP